MDRNFALALILLYAIIVPVYVKKKGVVSYAFLAQRKTHTHTKPISKTHTLNEARKLLRDGLFDNSYQSLHFCYIPIPYELREH